MTGTAAPATTRGATTVTEDASSWCSSRACPAPVARPRPARWRTSAGSSSTTCRRRCCRRPIAEVQADVDDARLAVVVDVRGGRIFDDLADEPRSGCCDDGIDVRVLFLEAGDNELVRRFESSRRPHPLQGSGGILDGLVRERALLGDLRARADLVIDTSTLNVHDLRRKVDAAFGGDERGRAARHRDVLRLQVRPAARRRHRQRRALPAQPLLGARAARAAPVSTPR